MRVDVTLVPALTEAVERLEAVAREHPHEPVILMRDDRPVGAYVPLDALDEEALVVSLSPDFRAMTARSREQHRRGEAQSVEDVQRERGITEQELVEAQSEVRLAADQQ